MSTFDVKQENASGSVTTVSAFNDLLVAFQKQSPEKFAMKLASGEFARFAATLVQDVPFAYAPAPEASVDAAPATSDDVEGAVEKKRKK